MNFHIEIEPEDDSKTLSEKSNRLAKRPIEYLFESRYVGIAWLILFIDGVIIIQMLMWKGMSYIGDFNERGSFGDMFGAVNTLFSGLAFAGIIYTIMLQRYELSLQRKELQDTREELKLSREAHQNNCELMKSQLIVLQKAAEREQLLFDRQFLPVFVAGKGRFIENYDGNKQRYSQPIKNYGCPIKYVTVVNSEHPQDLLCDPTGVNFLDTDGVINIKGILMGKAVAMSKYIMTYQTLDGRWWDTMLKLNMNHKGAECFIDSTKEITLNN